MQVITIGRLPDNTIQLDGDIQVSRHHAQLTKDNGQYYITDLNSTNGTYVNGNIVRGSQRLQMRDVVRLGNTTIPWLMYFDENYVRRLNSQRRNSPKGESLGSVGRGVYVNPGSASINAQKEESNGMAVAGFILSFLFPILGLIFSAIGMGNANKLPARKGYGLALAGLIISIVSLVLWLIIVA